MRVNTARYEAIDGIRGMFALLVFLAHFHVQFHHLTHDQGTLFFVSTLVWCITRAAVAMFFALSGFLFYGRMMHRDEPYQTFVLARLQRLYPTFLFAFCVYLLVSLIIPEANKFHGSIGHQVLYIGANLMLLQAFLHPPMIVQTWTLTYTCAFYAILPGIIWLFKRLQLGQTGRLWMLSGIWLLALLSINLTGVMTNGIGFITGMLVAEMLPAMTPQIERFGRRAEMLAGILLIGTCAMLYAGFSWHGGRTGQARPVELFNIYAVWCRTGALSLATGAIFVLGFLRAGSIHRFLTAKPLLTMGQISYSWFLVHGLALRAVRIQLDHLAVRVHIDSSFLFVPALIVSLCVAWAVSWLTFHFVERRTLAVPALQKLARAAVATH